MKYIAALVVGLVILPFPVFADAPVLSYSYRLTPYDLDKEAGYPPDLFELMFGPTNINAVAGNGRLAVGFSAEGELTVLRWPMPTHQDQLRYLSRARGLPRMGAAENHGAFFGVLLNLTDGGSEFSWLRDDPWVTGQTYLSDDSDTVLTIHEREDLGIVVQVRDLVSPYQDVLVRNVDIERSEGSPVESVQIVFFENFQPCNKKIPYAPVNDWLLDYRNDFRVQYLPEYGVLLHDRPRDEIPGSPGTYAAIGFGNAPSQHQCGLEGGVSPEDAYQDALDGMLSRSATARGHVDAAMGVDLIFDGQGRARETLYIVLAGTQGEALGLLDSVRGTNFQEMLEERENWWKGWMDGVLVPDVQDDELLSVYKRALMAIRTCYAHETGAIAASIATQPPYAQDWPRDGSFINFALDEAGMTDVVTQHNLFYADSQLIEYGIYDMCYYADGIPGGPLFLELDNFGLTTYNLWRHYSFIENPVEAAGYLEAVYPSIAATADFFCWWRDPETGLPRKAFEADWPVPTLTITGALMAWAAMDSAIQASEVIGEDQQTVAIWEARRRELHDAIHTYFYDPEQEVFFGNPFSLASMIYPFGFLAPDDPRTPKHAELLWEYARANLAGETAGGGYDAILLWTLARLWKDDPDRREDLVWALDVWAKDINTLNTHLYGEAYVNMGGGRFDPRTGIPHVESGALTILTALELYGGIEEPEEGDDDDDEETGDDDVDDSQGCGC